MRSCTWSYWERLNWDLFLAAVVFFQRICNAFTLLTRTVSEDSDKRITTLQGTNISQSSSRELLIWTKGKSRFGNGNLNKRLLRVLFAHLSAITVTYNLEQNKLIFKSVSDKDSWEIRIEGCLAEKPRTSSTSGTPTSYARQARSQLSKYVSAAVGCKFRD